MENPTNAQEHETNARDYVDRLLSSAHSVLCVAHSITCRELRDCDLYPQISAAASAVYAILRKPEDLPPITPQK